MKSGAGAAGKTTVKKSDVRMCLASGCRGKGGNRQHMHVLLGVVARLQRPVLVRAEQEVEMARGEVLGGGNATRAETDAGRRGGGGSRNAH